MAALVSPSFNSSVRVSSGSVSAIISSSAISEVIRDQIIVIIPGQILLFARS